MELDRQRTLSMAALARTARRLPKQLRRSLTWDRGKEMAAHKDFSVATDVKVFFCDPHRSLGGARRHSKTESLSS
jgi:IS30 family transposase